MSEIEYCKACLQKKCEEHQWFGKPETEKEVLSVVLKHISDILPFIIEKVYLVETVLHEPKDRFFTNGKIDFNMETFAAHKKKDYYIPVDSYNAGEKGIIDYTIEVTALIIRHNPIDLKVRSGWLGETPMHIVQLIREADFLHCECIGHYGRIQSLARTRLNEFIATLENPV